MISGALAFADLLTYDLNGAQAYLDSAGAGFAAVSADYKVKYSPFDCNGQTMSIDDPNGCHYCGDGVIDDPEETCDDGNDDDGDGCSSACLIETEPAVCGDGLFEFGEECDDGNNVSGDGCSDLCEFEEWYSPNVLGYTPKASLLHGGHLFVAGDDGARVGTVEKIDPVSGAVLGSLGPIGQSINDIVISGDHLYGVGSSSFNRTWSIAKVRISDMTLDGSTVYQFTRPTNLEGEAFRVVISGGNLILGGDCFNGAFHGRLSKRPLGDIEREDFSNSLLGDNLRALTVSGGHVYGGGTHGGTFTHSKFSSDLVAVAAYGNQAAKPGAFLDANSNWETAQDMVVYGSNLLVGGSRDSGWGVKAYSTSTGGDAGFEYTDGSTEGFVDRLYLQGASLFVANSELDLNWSTGMTRLSAVGLVLTHSWGSGGKIMSNGRSAEASTLSGDRFFQGGDVVLPGAGSLQFVELILK